VGHSKAADRVSGVTPVWQPKRSCALTPTLAEASVRYSVEAIRRAVAGKALYGSDGPWLHPGLELANLQRFRRWTAPSRVRIRPGQAPPSFNRPPRAVSYNCPVLRRRQYTQRQRPLGREALSPIIKSALSAREALHFSRRGRQRTTLSHGGRRISLSGADDRHRSDSRLAALRRWSARALTPSRVAAPRIFPASAIAIRIAISPTDRLSCRKVTPRASARRICCSN
jgi:hypothetical protein